MDNPPSNQSNNSSSSVEDHQLPPSLPQPRRPSTAHSSSSSVSNTNTHNTHNNHNNNNKSHLLNWTANLGNNAGSGPVDLTVPSSSLSSSGSVSSSPSAATLSSGLPVFASAGLINSFGVQGNPLINANNMLVGNTRKQREFIPDSKKDESYWDRRKRNNEAAKRSREKRRISDLFLETRVLELTRENSVLKAELCAIKDKYNISHNQSFVDPEAISMPLAENATKIRRNRLFSSIINGNSVSILSPPAPVDYASSQAAAASFNYSCSLSPNSQSSSSSEVQVSSPGYPHHNPHQSLSSTCSPPTMCSLLSQSPAALGLSPASLLPVLAANSLAAAAIGNKTTLPFKLRHKASNGSHQQQKSNESSPGRESARRANNCETAGQDGGHESDTGSDFSATPTHFPMSVDSNYEEQPQQQQQRQLSSSSPDAMLKKENFVLKKENFALQSDLQRLASEVATLKNVFVYSSQSSALAAVVQQHAGGADNERMGTGNGPLPGGSAAAVAAAAALQNLTGSLYHHHHHHSHQQQHTSNSPPLSQRGRHSPSLGEHHSLHQLHHFNDDLDSKDLLKSVIKFQNLHNDIIV